MARRTRSGFSLIETMMALAIAITLGVFGYKLLYGFLTGAKSESGSVARGQAGAPWQSYKKFPPLVQRHLEVLKTWGKYTATADEIAAVKADVRKSIKAPLPSDELWSIGYHGASGSAIVGGGLAIGVSEQLAYIVTNDSKLIVVKQLAAEKKRVAFVGTPMIEEGVWLWRGPEQAIVSIVTTPRSRKQNVPKLKVLWNGSEATASVGFQLDGDFAVVTTTPMIPMYKGRVTVPGGSELWLEVKMQEPLVGKLGDNRLEPIEFKEGRAKSVGRASTR